MTNSYETVTGTEPDVDEQHEPRTVQHSRPDGSVHMMTEIGDGTFVAWTTCRACSKQTSACTCKGGPVEPEFMQRWRDERFTKSFERRSAEPALPVTLRHRDRRVAAVIRFLLARGYEIIAPGEKGDAGIIDPDDTSGDSDDPDYGGHVEPMDQELRDLREDGFTETSQREAAVDEGLDAALAKVRQTKKEDDSDVGF